MRRGRGNAESRIRAWWAPLLFLALVAVGGVVLHRWLMDPQRWPVRTVGIQDNFRHLDRRELQQALVAAVDGSFFGVDLQAVRAAALALPWVAEARVRRIWPDRLEVEITEQTPVARWNDDGLVNLRGEVFKPRKVEAAPLVHFRGPEGKAGEMLEFYRGAAPLFARRGLHIGEIRLDRRGEWRLQLDPGPMVVVGRERTAFRIRRLLEVHPVLVREQEGRPMRRIDLRYDQGFAVAWTGRK